MDSRVPQTDRRQTGNQTAQCTPMHSPALGTFTLTAGNGTSVGTVFTLVCRAHYRAFSGGLISCVQDSNGTHWSGGIPECRLATFDLQGFRLAVLLSIVSVAIIMLMSILFITSSLLKCVRKEKARQLVRKRTREQDRLWQQLNAEEQRESFYSHGSINNNNNNNSSSSNNTNTTTTTTNNNNNSSSSSSRQEQQLRCHQQNYPDPLTIHYSQLTLGQMAPSLSYV